MQEKTNMLADKSVRLGLTISRGKRKVFKNNASKNTHITVQSDALKEVDSSTYLGRILENQGGRMQMSEPARVKHEQPSIS
ncbi:hypothetical protein DPMN_034447 [Dreissena polymorpha]|uniref:Uncharacterized protein n=1 Tax=Dreissena polymorpha TaxID=45954 RepID=A0A9D4M5J2_DREPO|nr:hypothetical protein DPMN_034447 [Dreissena polymorpha]